MSPSRRVLYSAIVLLMSSLTGVATPVRAQFPEDVEPRGIEIFPPLLERSPRLQGMGRLTLVVPDEHNHLRLWDFAGNPTGILDEDSVSVIELRPGTARARSMMDFAGPSGSGTRQDLALGRLGSGFEMWRRNEKNTVAFGAIGEAYNRTLGIPYDDDTERGRSDFRPAAMLLVNGRMPYVLTDRMEYAVRLNIVEQGWRDQYRLIFENAAGQFIGKDGELLPPPNRFDEDESSAISVGGGLAFSYRFGPWGTLAAGGDWGRTKIISKNEGDKYYRETQETRPYTQWQLTMVGRPAPRFEYGLDGRWWNSESDADFVYSQSQGQGAIPVSARGPLYDRDEDGNSLRGRVRWAPGRLELGGSYDLDEREVGITAPDPTATNSFNHFLNDFFNLAQSDTIVFPDSIRSDRATRTRTAWAVGGSWRFDPRTIAGIEYHARSDEVDQDLLDGRGPEGEGWDVRVGAERQLTESFRLRGGYIHRWEDRDKSTAGNEFNSGTVTLGFGARPVKARWLMEFAWGLTWGWPDYGSPVDRSADGQSITGQLRWEF